MNHPFVWLSSRAHRTGSEVTRDALKALHGFKGNHQKQLQNPSKCLATLRNPASTCRFYQTHPQRITAMTAASATPPLLSPVPQPLPRRHLRHPRHVRLRGRVLERRPGGQDLRERSQQAGSGERGALCRSPWARRKSDGRPTPPTKEKKEMDGA